MVPMGLFGAIVSLKCPDLKGSSYFYNKYKDICN